MKALAVAEMPDPDSAITAAGYNKPAIGRYVNVADATRVPMESL